MRAELFDEAKALTPYTSVLIGEEVFVVATDDTEAFEKTFVDGWDGEIAMLARAVACLAELGLRPPAESTFVEAGANIGVTTVIALRRHGFAAAVTIEPAAGRRRALRVNVTANDVDGRVRIFDALAAESMIDPSQVGLLWLAVGAEGEALPAGTETLLEAGVPLVVAVEPGSAGSRTAPAGLLDSRYTDFVDLRPDCARRPIGELRSFLDSLTAPTSVLLVRR